MNNYCFDIVDYRLFFLNIEERQTRNSFYKIDFTLGAEKKVQGFKHTTAMRQKRGVEQFSWKVTRPLRYFRVLQPLVIHFSSTPF